MKPRGVGITQGSAALDWRRLFSTILFMHPGRQGLDLCRPVPLRALVDRYQGEDF
jgi:hypothetical protein